MTITTMKAVPIVCIHSIRMLDPGDLLKDLWDDDRRRRLRSLGLNLERQCLDHSHSSAQIDFPRAANFDDR